MKTISYSNYTVLALVFMVSACGGGGSGTSQQQPQQPPPQTTVKPLSDTSLDDPVVVSVLVIDPVTSELVLETGTYNTSSQTLTLGGGSVPTAVSNLDDSLNYVRVAQSIGGGEQLIISPTVNIPGGGAATYSGGAVVQIIDPSTATVYVGEMQSTMTVNFTNGTAVIELDGFDGTQQTGAGTPSSHTSGEVQFTGLEISGSTISGGDTASITGFGPTDLTGAEVESIGEFGGPSAEEYGAIVDADGPDGIFIGTIAGARIP